MSAQMEYKYIHPTKVDSPAVGSLYQARAGKKHAHAALKSLRENLRTAPLGGCRDGIRFKIMLAQSSRNDWLRMERDALTAIETRARQLGMTTHKTAGVKP